MPPAGSAAAGWRMRSLKSTSSVLSGSKTTMLISAPPAKEEWTKWPELAVHDTANSVPKSAKQRSNSPLSASFRIRQSSLDLLARCPTPDPPYKARAIIWPPVMDRAIVPSVILGLVPRSAAHAGEGTVLPRILVCRQILGTSPRMTMRRCKTSKSIAHAAKCDCLAVAAEGSFDDQGRAHRHDVSGTLACPDGQAVEFVQNLITAWAGRRRHPGGRPGRIGERRWKRAVLAPWPESARLWPA